MPKPRNYIARSPLMRKGGVHSESKSGQRAQSRHELDAAIDEWFDSPPDQAHVQPSLSKRGSKKGEPEGSPFLYLDYKFIRLTCVEGLPTYPLC